MNRALVRLLQLSSPALPVGAYSYSQGLEWAVQAGTVRDEGTALSWICDQLQWNLGRFEAPLLARMSHAHDAGDQQLGLQLDELYLASRESAELRAETLQMGHSLRRLVRDLRELPDDLVLRLEQPNEPSYAFVWSALAAAWGIAADEALTAWLWSWAENQVMASIKVVPLGQAAGQRMLMTAGTLIPPIVEQAQTLPTDAMSNFAPGFAIACARHETQYSRIFRS